MNGLKPKYSIMVIDQASTQAVNLFLSHSNTHTHVCTKEILLILQMSDMLRTFLGMYSTDAVI